MMSTNTTHVAAVRSIFGLLGMAAGAGVGWLAYTWSDGSWALAVLAGMLTMNLVARGAADIITDPDKGRRLIFFTLPTLLTAGGVAGAYALWNRWWLAVLTGVVFYFIGQMVVSVMFPRIAVEEAADSASRLTGGVTTQPRPGTGWSESDEQWRLNDKRF